MITAPAQVPPSSQPASTSVTYIHPQVDAGESDQADHPGRSSPPRALMPAPGAHHPAASIQAQIIPTAASRRWHARRETRSRVRRSGRTARRDAAGLPASWR